ncbi:hypothetical protein [Dictyobacter kobayashii]|uniref:Uncharacterized protein n=1 Tax=Dictyobacter kobayashii TaxID=2014872 RepID=A0A402AW25_9CHLR|nr:hypothetical protein [Dictyobacter kobayashii]GCE23297.1 hypothetical protein KDK_70970 [Dictyobacter kobayashii]
MKITEETIHSFPFQPYRKKARLHARPLTYKDYQQKQGKIQTLEGIMDFVIGDYLARGIQNEEWPISQSYFEANYTRDADQCSEGFAWYSPKNVRHACQIHQPFTVELKDGKTFIGQAGDYLINTGRAIWVVENDIFQQSYEAIHNTGTL